MTLKTIFFAILLFPTLVNADVIDSGTNGFIIESSRQVNASPEQAYQQFLAVNQWWDGSHSWFGSAENFSIEARAGGCFCELKGQQQVEHMRVSFVNPNKEIRMLGGLGPLQAMGVSGAMTWTFIQSEQGSKVTHRYVVSGYYPDGLDKLASIVDQVQTGQLERLAALLNAQSK